MSYDLEEVKAAALAVIQSQAVPEITSPEFYVRAGDVVRVLAERRDTIEAKRVEYTKPLLAQKKKIDADFKAALEPIENMIEKLRENMRVFYIAEQKRKDEEQKQLEIAARTAGDTSVAIVNDIKSQTGDFSTSTAVKKKCFEVMDITMVPKEFLTVDEKLVAEHMKNNFENPLAGLRYYYDFNIRVR